MNLGRLGKQLKREALKHPKQAGVLGLLALVALYFWAPLVMGWMGKGPAPKDPATAGGPGKPVAGQPGNPPTVGAAVAPVAVAPRSGTDKPASPQPESAKPTWPELSSRLDADPLCRTARLSDSVRDPFHGKTVVQSVSRRTPVLKIVQVEPTPQIFGAALSGTIISSARSMARIDGRTYRAGAVVELSKDGKTAKFVLKEIKTREVVLERNGKLYPLKISQPAGAAQVEMLGVTQ